MATRRQRPGIMVGPSIVQRRPWSTCDHADHGQRRPWSHAATVVTRRQWLGIMAWPKIRGDHGPSATMVTCDMSTRANGRPGAALLRLPTATASAPSRPLARDGVSRLRCFVFSAYRQGPRLSCGSWAENRGHGAAIASSAQLWSLHDLGLLLTTVASGPRRFWATIVVASSRCRA